MKLLLFASVLTLGIFSLNNTQEPESLKVGEKAPAFNTIGHSGNKIILDSLLLKGSVVLFFYRGSWCPYCNRQISELQDSLHFLTEKGASVVAISPETNESMDKIITKTNAKFTFISDTSYSLMNAYKVSFVVSENTLKKYKLAGINIEKANGNDDHILPVPATYVIGKNGLIKMAYFNTDCKKRVSIQQIISVLE